jgi:hypothetical protein
MTDIPERMRLVLREEGLDDLAAVLAPREWDEVPLVSRLSQLAFMRGLSVSEQTRILVKCAVTHLDEVLRFVATSPNPNTVVMISIFDWEELVSSEPTPVVPNFWISTDPARDLANFRLQVGSTREARELRSWLANDGLDADFEVFESRTLASDPSLRRSYIAKRNCAFLAWMT